MGAVELYQQQPHQPLVVDAVPVLSLNSLPLGFRFRPTDEELIDFYLRQKINGNGDDVWVIREIDICKWEPWDLPDLSVVRNKDPEWFFFCPQDRKYPNGHRLNRATTHGYWKATGKDRKIKSGSTLIGMKKTLVFYIGRAPKGKRTHWVMHEYRPTLKELDGTNPGQNPYVLCRLFKKQDDSLESSNCDEVERTTSTPTTANYSPEEIQSDPTQNPVSSSQATEDDKQLAVITENSEEAISNIITPVDCRSDGFGAQNQTVPVEPPMEQLNLDIFCNPNEQLDDKLFSPINVHIPSEFNYPSNNKSNGQHGLQDQYGTNEISISDFFDSYVDWDDIPNGESSSQMPNSTWFDVKGNGSWGDSNVAMTDLMHLQAFDAAYPGEAIDTKIPLVTTKEFHAMTSDRSFNELRSDIGLFENLPQMSFSTDVSMGQLYNVANDYQQPRNINTFVDGETGIRIRTRPQRQEPDVNTVMQLQGTAKRRIRLGGLVPHSHGSDEDPDSKPATAEEIKASEDHGAVESESVTSDVNEPEETLPEVSDSDEIASCVSEDHPSEDDNSEPTTARSRNVSEDHASSESSTVTNDADEPEEISRMLAASRRRRIGRRKVAKAKAESFSGLKDSLLSRGVSYTSKASSDLGISVLAVSATVVVLLGVVLLVNPWGYLKV